MPPAFNLSQDQTLQFISLGRRNGLSLLNGSPSLESAPSIFLKPLRLRQSTHTNYLNELLKSFSPLQGDRPFYTPSLQRQEFPYPASPARATKTRPSGQERAILTSPNSLSSGRSLRSFQGNGYFNLMAEREGFEPSSTALT